MADTVKYDINEFLRLKTDVLEQRRNILKNDLKAFADNQKEYLNLILKLDSTLTKNTED